MSDITKCLDSKCPLKETCHRYTAKVGFMQSYFLESPRKKDKCEMYWGENAENVYKQLKDILT